MNCTFFEFVHNSNQNVVIKDGKLEAYQVHSINGRGKDTFTYRHAFGSAIGISKKEKQMLPGCIPTLQAQMHLPARVMNFLKDSVSNILKKKCCMQR
jgi:hypothetical protein